MRTDAESLADVVVRAYACDVLARVCPPDGPPPERAPRGWGDLAERLTSVA